jgi:hypothetical protein
MTAAAIIETPMPFANPAQSANFGELTIESDVDAIAVYGNLDLRRDIRSADTAAALSRFFAAVETAIRATPSLPEIAQTTDPKATTTVKNPFVR